MSSGNAHTYSNHTTVRYCQQTIRAKLYTYFEVLHIVLKVQVDDALRSVAVSARLPYHRSNLIH